MEFTQEQWDKLWKIADKARLKGNKYHLGMAHAIYNLCTWREIDTFIDSVENMLEREVQP